MTGIKVDAVHFAKQGLRGLGWLLSCRRHGPAFSNVAEWHCASMWQYHEGPQLPVEGWSP